MTTIYTVHVEDAMEHEIAVPTLKEARKLSRDNHGVAITEVKVARMPLRQLLCAVFNRGGYAASSEDVE